MRRRHRCGAMLLMTSACGTLPLAPIGAARALEPASDPSCSIVRYRVRAIPLEPRGINDAMTVAGIAPGHRAAVWSARNGLRLLPLPSPYTSAEAVDINARGHVLITAYDRTFAQHGTYLYADGRLTALAGDQARGFHLNDHDEVVGEAAAVRGRSTDPVYWTASGLHRLQTCCGGSATALNNDGVIVGDVYDQDGRYHAVRWTAATGPLSIGPAHRYSSAVALSDSGLAVVQSFPETYLDSAEGLRALAIPGRSPAHPNGINRCDLMVGAVGPYSDKDRAFVWSAHEGFKDLNTLMVEAPGWILKSAAGINSHGSIVGTGELNGEENRGFVLTPIL